MTGHRDLLAALTDAAHMAATQPRVFLKRGPEEAAGAWQRRAIAVALDAVLVAQDGAA